MTRDSPRLSSINAHIVNVARATNQDPNRVRRRLAFHRLAARLASSGWVLKGGFCLEVRLPGAARATQDMDVVRTQVRDGDALLDELDLLLALEIDDGFAFDARAATPLRGADDQVGAWRVGLDTFVDSRPFTALKLDLVTQIEEVSRAVEPLIIPSPVPGLGLPEVVMPAVDVYQHAAEKFHAMGRWYAGERPSTRVKDLVDLVLLVEAGLLVDPGRLGERLRVVHELRDGVPPPADLAPPPRDWEARYARLVADLPLQAATCAEAYALVHPVYHSALKGHP